MSNVEYRTAEATGQPFTSTFYIQYSAVLRFAFAGLFKTLGKNILQHLSNGCCLPGKAGVYLKAKKQTVMSQGEYVSQ